MIVRESILFNIIVQITYIFYMEYQDFERFFLIGLKKLQKNPEPC